MGLGDRENKWEEKFRKSKAKLEEQEKEEDARGQPPSQPQCKSESKIQK